MPSMFILLALAWAFIYWILGGVFFSIIALLRVGRVRRTWFGCLFSFSALGMGVFAAWAGLRFSADRLASCLIDSSIDRWHAWMARFSCGIVEHVGSFLIGFLLLIALGAILMIVSTSSEKAWIKKGKQNNP